MLILRYPEGERKQHKHAHYGYGRKGEAHLIDNGAVLWSTELPWIEIYIAIPVTLLPVHPNYETKGE